MAAPHTPRVSRRGCLAGMAAGAAALLSCPVLLHLEQRLRIERVAIPPDADAPWPHLKLAQLSDLHVVRPVGARRVAAAVELVNAWEPDIVVLTGDYVTGSAESIALAAPLLAQLRAPLGVYACLGNHDLWADRLAVTRGLEQAGVRVLVNEGLALERERAAIYLAGLDSGMAGRPDLAAALEDHDGRMFVALLFHEPDLGHDMVAGGRVWLQLAGHSHGGQVRVPGRGALILPPYAQRYDQGLYPVGSGWIYVNRGLGTTFIPLRLNCPPEVTLLDLRLDPMRAGAS